MFEYVISQGVLNEEILSQLAQMQVIGLDIETRGLDPKKSEMLSLQLGNEENQWVFDARKVELASIFELLTQTNPLIVGHNLKFDLAFLQHLFEYFPKRCFDTQIAYGLLKNGLESPYVSYQDLVLFLVGKYIDKDVRKTFKYTTGGFSEAQIAYAAGDVEFLLPLYQHQVEELRKASMFEVAKLEFSLIPVIIDLEQTGIKIDSERWLEIAKKSQEKANELELQLADIVGNVAFQDSFLGLPKTSLNPRSNKQMLKAFHDMKVDIKNTQAGTLKMLDHPLAKTLLEFRAYQKQVSTYGVSFLEKHLQDDGRVHSTFNQLGAQSGRLSSSSPNLQNIPIRRTKEYRECFIADEDKMFVTADFQQIELKTAAVLSGEQVMIDEYNSENPDLHTLTASRIYGVDLEAVTPEQRSTGKNGNFSVLYQISPRGFMFRYGGTEAAAQKIITGFWSLYPTLHKYILGMGQRGIIKGYAETRLGRRRYFKPPPLNSYEYKSEISRIRREAANHPVQGTAGDILKRAMVKTCKKLEQYNAHIVNVVHDEIVIETPKEYVSEVVGITYNEMEDAGQEIMGAALDWSIDLHVGNCWKK